MNFGVGSTFSKGPWFGFSEGPGSGPGPLYKVCPNKYFWFNGISNAEIEKEILNLDTSKACQDSNITTKVIKSNLDIFTDALHSEFKRSLATSVFPPSMKLANVTPVH